MKAIVFSFYCVIAKLVNYSEKFLFYICHANVTNDETLGGHILVTCPEIIMEESGGDFEREGCHALPCVILMFVACS